MKKMLHIGIIDECYSEFPVLSFNGDRFLFELWKRIGSTKNYLEISFKNIKISV